MRNFFLERQLRRIERDVNNDLLMILEVGPQYYSNRELHCLVDNIEYQETLLRKLQRHLFVFLASIPLWVCIYFLANAFGFHTIALGFLYFVPISLMAFTTGTLYSRYHFQNCRHANLIRSIIQQELERRRKDASIS